MQGVGLGYGEGGRELGREVEQLFHLARVGDERCSRPVAELAVRAQQHRGGVTWQPFASHSHPQRLCTVAPEKFNKMILLKFEKYFENIG